MQLLVLRLIRLSISLDSGLWLMVIKMLKDLGVNESLLTRGAVFVLLIDSMTALGSDAIVFLCL